MNISTHAKILWVACHPPQNFMKAKQILKAKCIYFPKTKELN